MVSRHEYELAKSVEVAAALQQSGEFLVLSVEGSLITIAGTPDYQIRVTAIDPQLSGGFGMAASTQAAITASLDAALQDVADEREGNVASDRRNVGDRETDSVRSRYQIGIGTISGRATSKYRRMVA